MKENEAIINLTQHCSSGNTIRLEGSVNRQELKDWMNTFTKMWAEKGLKPGQRSDGSFLTADLLAGLMALTPNSCIPIWGIPKENIIYTRRNSSLSPSKKTKIWGGISGTGLNPWYEFRTNIL